MINPIAYFFWDPQRAMLPFNLPLLGRPLLWYGFFFSLGFFLGYFIFLYLLKKIPSLKTHAKIIAEKVTFYLIVGVLVGARLGDLLFYQRGLDLIKDPFIVVKIWEGGLASHGGALGALIAVWILARRLSLQYPILKFTSLLDLLVIPTGLVAACIRVGNFFNQEILGKPTDLFFGVIFGHPADGSRPIPRHPVQLYEAIFYLALFALTFTLWKKVASMRTRGRMSALFLILIFTFRFLIEFLKEEQSAWLESTAFLTMGQWLSLPFIFLGLYFFFCTKKRE